MENFHILLVYLPADFWYPYKEKEDVIPKLSPIAACLKLATFHSNLTWKYPLFDYLGDFATIKISWFSKNNSKQN